MWVQDLVRGTSTRLTSADDHFSPAWSSDGTWVIVRQGVRSRGLYRRAADGRPTIERLTSSDRSQAPNGTTPDGTTLAYVQSAPETGWDIWVMTLPTVAGATPATPAADARPFVQTRFNEDNAAFSPDGRWLAYQSNEPGRFEGFVRSFPDGARTVQVSTAGGIAPVWTPSGDGLLFRAADNSLKSATVRTTPDFIVKETRTLFDASSYENTFAIAPDGRRLLMMPLVVSERSATEVRLVLNFLDELRLRVR